MSTRKNFVLKSKKVKAPSRLVVVPISKGLNTFSAAAYIDDKELSNSLNIAYDENGIARMRDGSVTISTALGNASGLAVYRTESINQIMTVDNGTWKYLSGTTWLSVTGTTFSTSTYPTTFTQASNSLVGWNGVDGGMYYDGSTVQQPGTMPKAKFSLYYKSKHIASGVDGQSNRLYIANTSNVVDFTVTTGGTAPQPDNVTDVPGATVFAGTPGLSEANIIDVQKNDGDKITGLGVFQDQVIVFKENSIFSLTFDSTGAPTLTPITFGTGCVSHTTIRQVENDLFFLSRQGLRSLGNQAQYFGAIRTSVLSLKVQTIIDLISESGFTSCNSAYFNNQYLMAGPIAKESYNNSIVVYNKRFGAFSHWAGIDAKAMVVYTESDNSQRLYYLNTAGTQLYALTPGQTDDSGTAIWVYLESKLENYGNLDITKFFVDLGLLLHYLYGTATVTLYDPTNTVIGDPVVITGATGSSGTSGMGLDVLGTPMLGQGGTASTSATDIGFTDQPIRIVINRQLRGLKFRMESRGVTSGFGLAGMVYAVFPNSHYLFDSSMKYYT